MIGYEKVTIQHFNIRNTLSTQANFNGITPELCVYILIYYTTQALKHANGKVLNNMEYHNTKTNQRAQKARPVDTILNT